MVDMVVHRHELRPTLARLCRVLSQARRPPRQPRCRAAGRRAAGCPSAAARMTLGHDDAGRLDPRAAARAASEAHRSVARPHASASWSGSAIPSGGCRRSSMSPAPTARAPRSRSCAPCWRRRARACTSTPRRNLVRINERFRLGAPGGGSYVDRTPNSPTRSPNASASTATRRSRFSRSTTAAAFVLFARHQADVSAARSRPRRPARRHQRDRAPARHHRHAGLDGSRRVSRRHDREDRRREGRHLPRRRAGRDRAADRMPRRPCWSARPPGCARRCMPPASNGPRASSTAASSIRTSKGLLDLPPPKLFGRHQFDNAGTAIAALRAAGVRLPVKAVEQGLMRAEWPARLQRLTTGALRRASRPRAPSSGSTAATTRTAGAPSRRRWAISKSACRVRWCWSSACCRPRTTRASCATSPGWCGACSRVPIHQDKGVPVEEIAAAARAAGMPADASASIEDALAGDRHARLRSAAAHPDHRLALSRGRSAGRERHGAGVAPQRKRPAFGRPFGRSENTVGALRRASTT